jgi:hypothetical protein
MRMSLFQLNGNVPIGTRWQGNASNVVSPAVAAGGAWVGVAWVACRVTGLLEWPATPARPQPKFSTVGFLLSRVICLLFPAIGVRGYLDPTNCSPRQSEPQPGGAFCFGATFTTRTAWSILRWIPSGHYRCGWCPAAWRVRGPAGAHTVRRGFCLALPVHRRKPNLQLTQMGCHERLSSSVSSLCRRLLTKPGAYE